VSVIVPLGWSSRNLRRRGVSSIGLSISSWACALQLRRLSEPPVTRLSEMVCIYQPESAVVKFRASDMP
jgi:hypothetical protein